VAFGAGARIGQQHGCTCKNAVPLYGRIDVIEDATFGPLLLEAELFEPSFFVEISPGAAERFADAVVGRLAQL
jgi:hypothetical protein